MQAVHHSSSSLLLNDEKYNYPFSRNKILSNSSFGSLALLYCYFQEMTLETIFSTVYCFYPVGDTFNVYFFVSVEGLLTCSCNVFVKNNLEKYSSLLSFDSWLYYICNSWNIFTIRDLRWNELNSSFPIVLRLPDHQLWKSLPDFNHHFLWHMFVLSSLHSGILENPWRSPPLYIIVNFHIN